MDMSAKCTPLTAANFTSWPVPNHNWSVDESVSEPSTQQTIIGLSLLYSLIQTIGIAGNLLVIYVILSDRKMRRSGTNLFILNLAVADLTIMVLGVSEIVQFILNRGWLLGLAVCRAQRFLLVTNLYASIITLSAVCVERYVAIVHPFQAHIYCSRRRVFQALAVLWPAALTLALPVAVYNTVTPPSTHVPVSLCLLRFPRHHNIYQAYKLTEFALFFLAPVVLQMVLYSIVGKKLFVSKDRLHRKQMFRNGKRGNRARESGAIEARKGVVKMLIASVIIYFTSYAPVQVPVFYNMLSGQPLPNSRAFHVLVITLAYVNSAANPLLYSIFSENFRRRFARALCCVQQETSRFARSLSTTLTDSSFNTSSRNQCYFGSQRSVVTSVSEL